MTYIMTSLMMAGQAAQAGADGVKPSASGGIMSTLLMFVPMALIFYFLIIRPQKKQQKEQKSLLESLKKGDAVQLNSGILGTITKINEDKNTIMVEVDKGTHTTLEVVRSAVAGIANGKVEK